MTHGALHNDADPHGALHSDADPHGDPHGAPRGGTDPWGDNAPHSAPAPHGEAPHSGADPNHGHSQGDQERLRRWRLVLGGQGADGTGCSLSGADAAMDRTLEALYGSGGGGGSGGDGATAGRGG
ncbi:hypothetical protein LUV28_46980, partial [Streptomyces sp. 8ZJF_21]|nr:hypothetical protein [Streptomyces sp. 8ZJF_21]